MWIPILKQTSIGQCHGIYLCTAISDTLMSKYSVENNFKWHQNRQFTSLRETMSIPFTFMRVSPPGCTSNKYINSIRVCDLALTLQVLWWIVPIDIQPWSPIDGWCEPLRDLKEIYNSNLPVCKFLNTWNLSGYVGWCTKEDVLSISEKKVAAIFPNSSFKWIS